MYEINELHKELLHRITSTSLDDDLPSTLVADYIKFKNCCDKIGIALTMQDLAWMCANNGYGKEAVKDIRGVVELFRDGEIGVDTPVKVIWGKGPKRPGMLRRVTASGDVYVVLDGEGDERKLSADKVKVA
jgi:hypothetical protein